ncbi:Asp23/Gls24 family envelope stress response protein [Arthrobacter sp. CAN_A1]|uniref:Asp23/Gls24 family envelope stress response protein n=1 Tax=Arthrobacter sp. CAN_A1 TaxID=2787717 RepID=UPI0018CBDC3C
MSDGTQDPGCGHSLDELEDYLLTGHSPAEQHYQRCPECQAGLAGLRSLHRLTGDLAAADTEHAGSADEPWLQSILGNLRLEMRSGRSVPLSSEHPDDSFTETEGSLLALIRSTGDDVDGATIGKCRLHGDITEPGADVRIEVTVTAFYGHPLPSMIESLRSRIAHTVLNHSELNLTSVDVAVTDVHEHYLKSPKGEVNE